MTARNRHKNSEKTSAPAAAAASPGAEDASKKSQRSCLGLLLSSVFYLALLGAAGFTAVHLQKVTEEMRLASSRQEESSRVSQDLARNMDSLLQQVGARGMNDMTRLIKSTPTSVIGESLLVLSPDFH